MDPESHMPSKCLGPECVRRVESELKPVCVTVCPANAGDFGDLDDPESSISRRVRESITIRLREELGTKPRNVVVLRVVDMRGLLLATLLIALVIGFAIAL